MRLLQIIFFIFFQLSFGQSDEVKDDSQIFELQRQLTELFGSKANFYSVLDIDKSAQDKEITKAYRQVSLKWHPDKNQEKDAEKFYKMITTIQATLRDPDLRARYDKHLEKGFPVWRGDSYYNPIWEPSAITVILFILMVVSIAQYISLLIIYYRDNSTYHDRVKEIEEKFATRSPAQIRKDLKRAGISESSLSKKAFKGGRPQDILAAAGLIEYPPQPVMPQIFDVVIVSLPLWIVKKLGPSGGASGAGDKKTE